MLNKGSANIILIILVVVLAGTAAYLALNKEKTGPETIASYAPTATSSASPSQLASPSPMPTSQPSQILTEQPGKIISLTSNGTEWNVTIELLTRNPEWLPGVGNEPFFIDQNKSLTVKASQDTKAYLCGTPSPNKDNWRPTTPSNLLKEGTTVYFDIDVTNNFITAIYQQCLP